MLSFGAFKPFGTGDFGLNEARSVNEAEHSTHPGAGLLLGVCCVVSLFWTGKSLLAMGSGGHCVRVAVSSGATLPEVT